MSEHDKEFSKGFERVGDKVVGNDDAVTTEEEIPAAAAATEPEEKPAVEEQVEEHKGLTEQDATSEPEKTLRTAPQKGDGKDEQRRRSLDGILKSEKRKREEAEADRARLQSELESLRAAQKQPERKQEEVKTAAEDNVVERLRKIEKVKKLEAEYGSDFVDALVDSVKLVSDAYDKKFGDLNQSIEARTKALVEEMKPQLEQVSGYYRQTAQEAHEAAIYDAHPDLDEYMDSVDDDGNAVVGKLSKWVETHPLEEVWRKYLNEGSVDQVNYMLETFKKESGIVGGDPDEPVKAAEAKAKADAKRDEALRKMQGVKTKSRPVSPASKPAGTFDSGWNSAARQ